MEQPQKRKRFQFIETNDSDPVTDALMLVASEFSKSPHASTSRWLSIAATKIAKESGTVDMVLLFPAKNADEGEIIDDDWALTSNWSFYILLSKQGETSVIKVIGTMFPEEEESQVGRQIQVKLPEYLLLAKGNVELQGRNFIAASNMAPISEEGEKEQERKIIKTVSLYGIRDLDNHPRECSQKNEGLKRMVIVAGIIRLMGYE